MSALRAILLRLELPLLRLELVGLLRTRRAYLLLLASVLVSSLLPLLSWPAAGSAPTAWFRNVLLFSLFFHTQLTAVLIVIPAFTAGAISGERERGTYELLYTTLLRPWSIVVSKALASSGYVLLLLAATAPCVAVLYVLGGLEFGSIARCYAVTFAAAAMSGLVCLAQSMRCARTAQAAVRGMFSVVFWNGGLALVILLLAAVWLQLGARDGGRYQVWAEVVAVATCLTPYGIVGVEIFGGRGGGGASLPWGLEPWHVFLGYAGAISACQLLFLLRRVRTPERPPTRRERRLAAASAAAAAPVAAQATTGGPRPFRPRRLRRSLTARALLAIGEGRDGHLGNPVFLKELRSEFFARRAFRGCVFWGLLALLVLVSLSMGQEGVEQAGAAVGCTALAVLLLLAPAVAASSFPREIEQGNLDFLRGTLLGLGQVLRGKCLAALYATSGIPAAAALVLGFLATVGLTPFRGGVFVAGSRGTEAASTCLVALAVILTTWVSTIALAMLASAVSRRSLAALLIAYGVLIGGYLVLPMFLAMSGGGRDLLSFLSATNPFAALVAFAARSHVGEGGVILFFPIHLVGALFILALASSHLEGNRERDP